LGCASFIECTTNAIARGLLYSVLSAVGLVGFLLFVVFRTIRLVIIRLLPSLLPIAAVFGGLGFISGHVNMGTAMVAAFALGMVSDNTFHYLIAWRALEPRGTQALKHVSQYAPVHHK
jgi:predicted RND superfamily exporter protein